MSLQDNIFELKDGFFSTCEIYIFNILFLFSTTLSLLGHGEGTLTYPSELNVSPDHRRALYEHMVVWCFTQEYLGSPLKVSWQLPLLPVHLSSFS